MVVCMGAVSALLNSHSASQQFLPCWSGASLLACNGSSSPSCCGAGAWPLAFRGCQPWKGCACGMLCGMAGTHNISHPGRVRDSQLWFQLCHCSLTSPQCWARKLGSIPTEKKWELPALTVTVLIGTSTAGALLSTLIFDSSFCKIHYSLGSLCIYLFTLFLFFFHFCLLVARVALSG